MHDPSVVVFSIKRPPFRARRVTRRAVWSRENLKPPFTRLGTWEGYWPSLFTVWHEEPEGRDSGTVCGRLPSGTGLTWKNIRWAWKHRAHLNVQWHFKQKLNRFLHERCTKCGKRYPWGYAPVSHSWGGGQSYHHECSTIVMLTGALDEAREAIDLVGIEADTLRAFGMDSTKAWRVLYNIEKWKERRAANEDQDAV